MLFVIQVKMKNRFQNLTEEKFNWYAIAISSDLFKRFVFYSVQFNSNYIVNIFNLFVFSSVGTCIFYGEKNRLNEKIEQKMLSKPE